MSEEQTNQEHSEMHAEEHASSTSPNATSTNDSSEPAGTASEPSLDRPVEMSEDVSKGQQVVTPDTATLPGADAPQQNPQRAERPKNGDRGKRRPERNGGVNRERRQRGHQDDSQSGSQKGQPRQQKAFKKFVVVTWSSQREPVDNMYWAEAEREGDWIVVNALDQVRTRREILERLQELDSGLVALEFNFSYPKDFLEFLKQDTGLTDWRSLIKRVREDLKKNAEDGTRAWIERMGRYREANLEPEEETRERMSFRDRRGGRDMRGGRDGRGRGPLQPHERRSLAERFRRTDLTLRRAAENHLVSPIQIAYNRLTNRYEFNDPNVRGRGALLGMSMLDQLLETKPETAVWPFAKQGKLTVVELQPWIFTKGKTREPDEIRKLISAHEDAGWDIPASVRDAAARNADAQRAFLSLMSIIKTENRDERSNRPLRDYQDSFYADPQVQVEGWFYGVGYRSAEQPKQRSADESKARSAEKSEHGAERSGGKREARQQSRGAESSASEASLDESSNVQETSPLSGTADAGFDVSMPTSPHEVAPAENPIVNEPSSDDVDAMKEMSSADVRSEGADPTGSEE